MIHDEYVNLSDKNSRQKLNSKDVFFDSDLYHKYHSSKVSKVIKFHFTINNELAAIIFFGITEDYRALSPYSSPFSYLQSFLDITVPDICFFFEGVLSRLRILGIKTVHFQLFPEHYDIRLNQKISIGLLKLGFIIDFFDVNSFIKLQNFSDSQSYLDALGSGFKKNIKRALRENLSFEELTENYLPEAYNVISMNRSSKGYPLNLSQNHISELIKNEILKVKLFGVSYKSNIIAAAFIFEFDYRAYVLYWGDIVQHRFFSPMSLLIFGIVKHYLSESFIEIDLGASSKNGIINEGLLYFKDSILTNRSSKYMYLLNIESK